VLTAHRSTQLPEYVADEPGGRVVVEPRSGARTPISPRPRRPRTPRTAETGRAIALLLLAERLNHGTYNVSTGRLVRNSEIVAAINAVAPGANITLRRGAIPTGPRTTTSTPPGCGRTPAFRPEYDAERAVPDYVGWLRGHADLGRAGNDDHRATS
jgi:hypothetical protein